MIPIGVEPLEHCASSPVLSQPTASRCRPALATPSLARQLIVLSPSCDGCRKVKERCEGGMPCRRCTHLKRPCVFSGATSKFATAGGEDTVPGSGVTTTPRPISEQTPEELQQLVGNLQRIVSHYVGNINLDADGLKRLADAVSQGLPPHEASRDDGITYSSSDSADDVKLDDITVQPLENNVTHYSGEFSHWNFSMRIKNWIDQSGPYRTDAPDAPKIREFYRIEELQSPSDASKLLSSCPPRGIADFLTRVFFNHAESNYFFIDRTWLNRKLDVIYDSPSSLTQRDVPTLCIVFMVFAVGTQYAYLDCRTSNGGREDQNMFSEDNVGVTLYQDACRLLPDVITIASLESVQACLLIGLYTLPLDPSGISWVYLNLASKVAIQNGMHRKAPDQALHPYTSETRNRVWWTLYLLEKRVGTLHGRPLSISSGEMDADWPVERPEIWPGSPPTNTSFLIATLHLGEFLGQVSKEIARFKTQNKQITLDVLTRLVKIKEDLHKWWQCLPDNVSYPGLMAGMPVPRAALHLRLEFCMVRMYAGRLFIVPTNKPTDSLVPSSSHSATDEPSPRTKVASQTSQQRRQLLVADCVDAALFVVDTCRLLNNSMGLARASYTEFSTLRIALLVILSQFLAKRNRTDYLRQPLWEGLQMLKSMSNWGASARFDASLIEAFEHAIARMEDGNNQVQASSQAVESSYEMFKRWESAWKTGSSMKVQPAPTDHSSTGVPEELAAASFSTAGALPPLDTTPGGTAWGADPGTVARLRPDSADTSVPPDTASTFGIDWNYSTMPVLEGLSAMLEEGYGFGVDMDGNPHPQQHHQQQHPQYHPRHHQGHQGATGRPDVG
ncbi:unnamed protein product [Clonostachys rhizophaga]|uniref:Zn(2)-C6 fungal-type domain-containing protein n=1 Tax=Clonostachys rhizophaga TaxID=160324 RepID=A0A9N9VDN3_9HYPO|nr:unnamed protein product [Clonostachys rhizophaga]